MKERLKRGFAAVLLGALIAAPMVAQGTHGSIRVVVTDPDGAALPGATVSIEAADSLIKRTVLTGSNGDVVLGAIDPGSSWIVVATLDGFAGARHENVLVTSGQTTTVRVQMQLAEISEQVVVTADSPLVDVESAVTGQEITLQLTEALPTGRSYQSYLQLVPGVAPDITTGGASSGNPASRSGINYADIGGTVGTSSDNFYYIEGINVTDAETGTFGANLNTEIIQEQKVLTGGIPAEYVGAPGLLSSVITKSGGSEFSGSVRYDLEDDSLVSDNDHSPNAKFSRDDTAATISGPLFAKDRAWFFGSYRWINRDDDITTLDTGEFIRTVSREDEQAFFKISTALTQGQMVNLLYLDDPTTISGSTDRTVVANRDRAREQGGPRYLLDYSGVFGPVVVGLGLGKHEAELSDIAAVRDPLNTIIFRRSDGSTLADQQLGGIGEDVERNRDTEFGKADIEWFLDTGAGSHTLKGGVDFQEHINFRNRVFTGPQFRGSLADSLLGVSAAQLADLNRTGQLTGGFFNVTNTSDFNGFMTTVNASANRASFYTAFDTDRDGTITQAELGAALTFANRGGNPDNAINYDRSVQAALGPQETSSEGTSVYLQDTWRLDRWTFNLGVRAEQWQHFATTGAEIFTFDWEYAPRISAVWDLTGTGRDKLSAYYGRYYDPIRNNLTNFAGTLSGTITEEQVFANNQWVTYRTRGGPVVLDAAFAPTTKTPYTDDILVNYQRDLGGSMAVEVSVYHRETKDVIEDYDLCLYAGSCYPGDPNAPGSLFLGAGYFGFTEIPQNINFFIATLAGGERTLDGAEIVLRKRLSNRWQGLASYTYSDAEGNTNSDSNADFAGDVIEMDPRAPNVKGTQPGSIEHIAKLAGSYHFDFGLVLGGAYRWNSGAYQNQTYLTFRRHLPVLDAEETTYNGATAFFIREGAVGGVKNPSYGVLDLSASYNRQFGPVGTEFFLSVFNALDEQSTVLTQDLAAGQGTVTFGDGTVWVQPRSISLGVRLSFGR